MCCILTVMSLIGPRAAILVWWLFDQSRWENAFSSFLWTFLGFIFAPWTTLAYVLVFNGGVNGFDWLWLGIGILLDVANWTGGAWGNRERLSR
jgi:hypothetical protein